MDLIQLTQAAIKGYVDQVALEGSLWPQIVESLDPQTRSFPNLKYYVRKTTEVQVEGCITLINIIYNIPLISSNKLWLYKIMKMPVFRDNHYQSICNKAEYVSWDHNYVLQYSKEEIDACKDLGYLLVCKKAKNIEKLRSSCLYSLAKNLSPKCNYTSSNVEQIKIQFESQYLVYFIPPGKVKLSNLYCDNHEKQAREMVNSGAIFVPEGCEIHVDDITYAPLITKPHTIIHYKPRLFKPDMDILKMHPTLPSAQIFVKERSQDDNIFLSDQADLAEADSILGKIKLSPDYVIWAGISFSTVLLMMLVLIIVLFVLYWKMSSFSRVAKRYRTWPHHDSE